MKNEIVHLLKKEFLVEWKQRYALGGLVLYVVSTIFVCYLSFKKVVDTPTWIALFWVILLFISVNAIAKSFMQESRNRNLYYYSIASPQAVILSKLLYNLLLMLALGILHLGFFILLTGNPVENMPLFLSSLLLGSAGFSGVLSMVSAISAKAGSNSTLMAILGFPILLPLLLTCIRLSKNAADGLNVASNLQFTIILLALNLLLVALSYILFPYLWRE